MITFSIALSKAVGYIPLYICHSLFCVGLTTKEGGKKSSVSSPLHVECIFFRQLCLSVVKTNGQGGNQSRISDPHHPSSLDLIADDTVPTPPNSDPSF